MRLSTFCLPLFICNALIAMEYKGIIMNLNNGTQLGMTPLFDICKYLEKLRITKYEIFKQLVAKARDEHYQIEDGGIRSKLIKKKIIQDDKVNEEYKNIILSGVKQKNGILMLYNPTDPD